MFELGEKLYAYYLSNSKGNLGQFIKYSLLFFPFMKTGTIKFFNGTKGYGFIKDDETGSEVFLHISGLIDQPVNTGDKVSYEVSQGPKGLNAVNVKKI
jgi:CspA family cold shock protein